MPVKGAKRHLKRLRHMSEGVKDKVFRELFVWGDAIRADAQHSIVKGAIQGKGHIPSKPGEPPKRDTGQLDTSIVTRADRANMRVEVVSEAPYSAALELGTSRMAERPFMRPASKRQRDPGLLRIRVALQQLAREGGK